MHRRVSFWRNGSQMACKCPTHRFEGTIVWRGGVSEDPESISSTSMQIQYILYITVFCSSPLPIFKLSLPVPWIDSSWFELTIFCTWLLVVDIISTYSHDIYIFCLFPFVCVVGCVFVFCRCYVVSCNKGNIILSMRPSLVTHKSHANTGNHLEDISQVKKGQLVKGYVWKVTDEGLVLK